MENLKKKFNVNNIELCLLIIMLIISFLFCMFQTYDRDEIEAVHTAWKLFRGQTIYIDFFQQKPPFFHITMIPFIKIFSDTLTTLCVCKIYCYILFLGIVYASSLISKYVFGSKQIYLMPILLLSCTVFTDKLTEVRPDTLSIMLIMFSIVFLYKNIRIKRLDIIISAILAGLSFAVLPKTAFYIILIFAIFCFRFFKKKMSLKDLCLYFLIMGITLIPFICYYAFKSISFEDFWFFNFTMNYKLLETFSPFKNLKEVCLWNCILYSSGFIGLFFLKGYRQKEIGFIAIMLFLTIFCIAVPNRQYYAPAVPFIAMLSANLIKRIKFLNRISIVFLLLIITTSVVFFSIQIRKHSIFYQFKRIAYVLFVTDRYDKVHDGSASFNLFRDDVDYFWFSVRPLGVVDTYRLHRFRIYDIYEDIKIYKPKVINVLYIDRDLPIIVDNYEPTDFKKVYVRKLDDK